MIFSLQPSASHRDPHSFPTRRSSDLLILNTFLFGVIILIANILKRAFSSQLAAKLRNRLLVRIFEIGRAVQQESETDLVCRLLLEKKKKQKTKTYEENHKNSKTYTNN